MDYHFRRIASRFVGQLRKLRTRSDAERVKAPTTTVVAAVAGQIKAEHRHSTGGWSTVTWRAVHLPAAAIVGHVGSPSMPKVRRFGMYVCRLKETRDTALICNYERLKWLFKN